VTLSIEIVGFTIVSNSKLTITFPAGASINVASPTCTGTVFVPITSCNYASQILEVIIGPIAASPSSFKFTVTNFVNPSTALDQWPLTGGFMVSYNASGNPSAGPHKLTGFDATALTSASITYATAANNRVGLKNA
jgi:hypothetical protein